MESLLAVTNPSDIYAHAPFDGHADHAKLTSSLTAAMVRQRHERVAPHDAHPPRGNRRVPAAVGRAVAEPDACVRERRPLRPLHAERSPSPPRRCRPATRTPPRPGRAGAPKARRTRSSTVPAAMQAATEAANLKWQVISRYATQIDCTPQPEYHVNCGYMRAFVKREEFFWKRLYSPLKDWPKPVHGPLDVRGLDLAAGTDLRRPVGARGQRDPAGRDRLRPA